MRRQELALLSIVTVISLFFPAMAFAAGGVLPGAGTETDPYLIEDIADFDAFAGNTDYWGGHTKLMTNINLFGRTYTAAVIAPDTDNTDWRFIGTPFTGIFDGNGYVIRNLTIDGANNCGLFGKLDRGSEVKNLGMEGIFITGTGSSVGGLVGYSYGSIFSAYSTGIVTGSDYYVGGLVGALEGFVTNCYSTCAVTGSIGVGGLVGVSEGVTTNCYSTGTVTGESYYIGGLIGGAWNLTSSYFYLYAGPDNGLGIALDDEQLQDKSSFAGFDFVGDDSDGIEDVWAIEPGYMPRLSWQNPPGFEVPYNLDSIATTLTGSGYEDDPFIIASYDDLMEFRSNTSLRVGHYSLTTDIDLTGVTYTEAFIQEAFSGSFSGNGHIISNLTIEGESFLGFFSSLYGSVDNLALKNVFIIGADEYVGSLVGGNRGDITNCNSTGVLVSYRYVGGLVGANNGRITNSYSSCSVEGHYYLGGLVGINDDNDGMPGKRSSIDSSYSTGAVTGTGYSVGGLVGSNLGDIIYCYSNSSVSGDRFVGGLVGNNESYPSSSGYIEDGSITECYSTGPVTGNDGVGGLVGANWHGNITSSFWDMDTSGLATSNGGTGKTTVQMQTLDTFADNGWDFVDNRADGLHDHWQIEPNDYPRPVEGYTWTLDGDGTPVNPYLIVTAADLGKIWLRPSAYYRLANDLDLTGIKWGSAIVPEFSGSFDGQEFVISNLTINRPERDGIGLFGEIDSSGQVQNIGIENINIAGNAYVGGFAGYNYGTINSCHASGVISGTDDSIGGLVGYSDSGTIMGCHSTGTVSGTDSVGGLVGRNDEGGLIISSFSSGAVNGGYSIGGLVGYNDGGSSIANSYSTVAVNGIGRAGGLVGANPKGSNITNCYSIGLVKVASNYGGGFAGSNSGSITSCYSTGVITGAGAWVSGFVPGSSSSGSINESYFYKYAGPNTDLAIALDDEQLQDKSSFAGFDFVGDDSDGTDDIWIIEPGYMPRLSWQDPPGFEAPYFLDTITTTLSGSGYVDDPFIIGSYDDLMEFRNNSSLRVGHYSLTTDIDLAGTTYTEAFIPEVFSGNFAGNGHIISNLTIEGNSNLGFFCGLLSGFVYEFSLKDISISGTGNSVGGLVAFNITGLIDNCSSTGMMSGVDMVGALTGYNGGSIKNSYTTGTVSGRNGVGGLAGKNGDKIASSYSSCSVDGSDNHVGGLVGSNSSGGNIVSSYSTGLVNGASGYVGGLVGGNYNSSVKNCYSTAKVTCSYEFAGGLVGRNYESIISSSYSTGVVTGSRYVGGLTGYSNGQGSSIINCYFYYLRKVNGFGISLDDEQLQVKLSFIGFDFAGDDSDGIEDHWAIEPGYMPRLSWQDPPGFETPLATITTTLTGSGYEDDPFIIASYDDLMEFRMNSNLRVGYYSLTTDIDLAGDVYPEAFIPETFIGNFAGNGHIISNLTIEGDSKLGFFSGLGGSVYSLALKDVSITGMGDAVAGLAGNNFGSITSSYSTGAVTGVYRVGGLVGVSTGSIVDSYSMAVAYGSNTVGGLVGQSWGYVTNCYSTGAVTATDTGGFGGGLAGGLIGMSFADSSTGSFWDVETSGIGIAGDITYYGATGLTTSQMMTAATFVDAGWDFTTPIWIIDEGIDYPRLWWEFDPIDLVDMLADDFLVFTQHKGTKKSLLSKLDTATKKLEDGNEKNDKAAVNSLRAFINAVNAQRGKKISEDDADNLITATQQIITMLSE